MTYRIAIPAALILSELLAPARLVAQRDWGLDIAPGAGPRLIESVGPDLAALLAAPAGERRRRAESLVLRLGANAIEALKRVRNPELEVLHDVLLEHQSWHVEHRALFILARYRDPAVLARAWKLASHAQARLRERAIITCIELWEPREGAAALGDPATTAVWRRLAVEKDFHVRRCLEALLRRIAGELAPERLGAEYTQRDEQGLVWSPFLDGWSNLPRVAPGFTPRALARSARRDSPPAQPSQRWAMPLLAAGSEEVAGVALQPFGNPRAGGNMVHTGQDAGACLDGAGLYAVGDGVVRLIHTGSDMGTLIVLEHRDAQNRALCSVYMHAGSTVFVRAGESVRCGQLLGTIGMGFSIENGGHFAHLHFGLYPGPFDPAHNYGTKRADQGLADWYDPVKVLPALIADTPPLHGEIPPLGKALAKIAAHLRKERYGRAFAAARVLLSSSVKLPEEVSLQAEQVQRALRPMVDNIRSRAAKLRSRGYPRAALELLSNSHAKCQGFWNAGDLMKMSAELRRDARFQKALSGEQKIEALEKRIARSAGRRGAQAKFRALWQDLLERYGDTCLEARLRAKLDR